jgi:hypothetical protein
VQAPAAERLIKSGIPTENLVADGRRRQIRLAQTIIPAGADHAAAGLAGRPWGGLDTPAVVYTYAPGRGAEHATALLAGYSISNWPIRSATAAR